MGTRDFAVYARSVHSVEGLLDPEVGAVGRVWLREEGVLPDGLDRRRMSLETAAVWTAVRLAREVTSELWAPWSVVLEALVWDRVDPRTLIARVAAEEPRSTATAISKAVLAGALMVDEGLQLLWSHRDAAPRAYADAILEPWTRAAAFPDTVFWDLLHSTDWRQLALDMGVHWRRAELMEAVSSLPGGWRARALSCVPTEHLDVEVVAEMAALHGVAALRALARAVEGPHRWRPDLDLLLEAVAAHGVDVAAAVATVVRHYEDVWCRRVAEVPSTSQVWTAHVAILDRLEHPAVTNLLETLWNDPTFPRDGLLVPLARRGVRTVLEAALDCPEALDHLGAWAYDTVMRSFEHAPRAALAPWLARQVDDVPEGLVVELLPVEALPSLFEGYPGGACQTLQEASRDPTRAVAAVRALGEHAPTRWFGTLFDLFLHTPAHPRGERTLSDEAWDALRAMDRRHCGRGHPRSLLTDRLVAWVEAAADAERALPRALERLLELEVAPANLSRLVRRNNPDVQKHALRLLGCTGRACQALPFLESADPKVQRAAIDALAGQTWAASAIAQLLHAPNMNVRRTAAVALRTCVDPMVLDALIAAVAGHDNSGLQREALAAAKHLVGDAVWRLLLDTGTPQAALQQRPVPVVAEWDGRREKLAEVRARPVADRLEAVVELGVPFSFEERQLARDSRANRAWAHGIGDRLVAGEVSEHELLDLLRGRHADRAIDGLLELGCAEQVLERAPVDRVRARWLPRPDTSELLVAAGARTLRWCLERGDLTTEAIVDLLREGPNERALGLELLLAFPAPIAVLLPLLDERPPISRCAARLLAHSPEAHEPLQRAFVAGRLTEPPRLPGVPTVPGPVDRLVALLLASATRPGDRRTYLEGLTPTDSSGRDALRRAFRSLPALLYVPDALRGDAIPTGLRPSPNVPDALIDALGDGEDSVQELLRAWPVLRDGRDRLPNVIEQHSKEPWAAEVLPRLAHWTTDPRRAVEVARAVGAYHTLVLDESLTRVPAVMRAEVLFALADLVDVRELLLDALLPPAGREVLAHSHPLDGVPERWRAGLWTLVGAWCRSRDPERARRALWALRGRPFYVDALVEAHEHPSRRVKLYANRLLRRAGPRAVWLDMAMALLDDAGMRRQMLRTLAYQGHLPAVGRMVEMLGRGRTAKDAEEALLAFGEPVVAELEVLLPHLRPDRRPAVVALLARLASSAGTN